MGRAARTLAAIAALALMCAAADAAPAAVPLVAPSACPVLADLALTASVLADEAIPREQMGRIAQRLYGPQSDAARRMVDLVIDAAYGNPQVRGAPDEFARRLLDTCVGRAGDLSSLLGVAL